MKAFKNYFGVFGPVSLLKVFIEEAKALGWKEYQHFGLEKEKTLWFDGPGTVHYGQYWVPLAIRHRAENIFELPEQWTDAMKWLSESEDMEKVLSRLALGGYKPTIDRAAHTITYGCQTFTEEQVMAIKSVFHDLTVEKLDEILSRL